MQKLTRVDSASTSDAPQPFLPSVHVSATGSRSSWGYAYCLVEGRSLNSLNRASGLQEHSLVRVPARQENVLDVLSVESGISRQGHMWALEPCSEATRHARERDDRSAERPGHHGNRLRLGESANPWTRGGGRDERPSGVGAGLYMAGNMLLLATRPPAVVVGSGQPGGSPHNLR